MKATTPHNTSVTKPPDIMNDDETNTWKSTLLPKGTRGKHKQIPHDATHNIHKKAIGYHPTIHKHIKDYSALQNFTKTTGCTNIPLVLLCNTYTF